MVTDGAEPGRDQQPHRQDQADLPLGCVGAVGPAEPRRGAAGGHGLQKGRTPARETEPVVPVSDEVVEKTLPILPEVVADMVRFQRLTGCRPGEVCILRPRDVDRSGEIWRYVPASHKTEHRDRQTGHLHRAEGQGGTGALPVAAPPMRTASRRKTQTASGRRSCGPSGRRRCSQARHRPLEAEPEAEARTTVQQGQLRLCHPPRLQKGWRGVLGTQPSTALGGLRNPPPVRPRSRAGRSWATPRRT